MPFFPKYTWAAGKKFDASLQSKGEFVLNFTLQISKIT